MLRAQKIIVIAAHPDDEVLGCGGTLLKYAGQGAEIAWLIATNMSESAGYTKARVEGRQQEIAEVAKQVPFQKVYQLDFPTTQLDAIAPSQLIGKISHCFLEFKPEVIFVLNRSDAHSDHRVLFQAVMACTKSFRYPFIKKILMYECLSETEFAAALPENIFYPNYFVDISPYFKRKIELMSIYASELAEHPFPRSIRNIEALATYRGATAGVDYAEAFHLLKCIE
ncbi:MAG: PIG-L family deacetylase [Methylococcaceae bacterium]|nr:PIG-L family deacetylase [Methylococcaceae bacterium]